MRNILRFLGFVAAAAIAVGALFLWKSASVSTAPLPPGGTTSTAGLAEMDREFTSLVGRILPSVVSINAIPPGGTEDPRAALLRSLLGAAPGATQPPQLGSGAIVSKDGFIVTNWHVIQQAASVEVHLSDGRSLPARLVGADRLSDVAVLKVDGDDLPPLDFADSDEVRIGQMVIAVGNPFGLQETVTKGIVSGKGRRMMSEAANEFFQTDAPINPGNSGGPLVDLDGRIIAMNNAVIQNTDGIGFAIPSNTVRRIFENIRDYGRVIRPWFGVSMLPISPALASRLGLPNARGAFVQATLDNSPAARAGILPGDIIVAYNNRPVLDWKDLRNRVAETHPGREVAVGVVRQGKKLDLRVRIEKQPGD